MKRLAALVVVFPLVFVAMLMFVFAAGKDAGPEAYRLPKYQSQLKAKNVSPKVVVHDPVFDFGIMDPLTMGEHTFVIRNDGHAPLEVVLGSTTCKCTLGKLTDSSILPGETTTVTMSWNTGRKHPVYSHGATIHTNDPMKKAIDLRVEGLVRVQLGFEPPELLFPRVLPDSTPTRSVAVYSQHWDDFSIEDVQSSLEGADWNVEALPTSQLESLNAKVGYRLHVTLPHGLARGHFQHQLTLHIKREGEDATETFDVKLGGKVLRRLSVYGPAIGSDGVIDLGSLKSGESHLTKVLLKVRDEQLEMQVDEVVVSPSFVNVQVSPHARVEGLYEMSIEVPADATTQHVKPEKSRILVRIRHPRINDLELRLKMDIY